MRKTTSFSQYSRIPDLVLSPVDRVSEVVFGLIMALTFTGGLSVATASETDVRAMKSFWKVSSRMFDSATMASSRSAMMKPSMPLSSVKIASVPP